MAKLTWLLATILLCTYSSDAAKVLVVFAFPGKSHGILGEAHVSALLEAGHEVTYITPFPRKDPPPNLHQVDVSDNMKNFPVDMINIGKILNKEVDPSDMSLFFSVLLTVGSATIENKNVQDLMKGQQQFDVILFEWLFTEIFVGLAAVFDCPYIWFSTVEPHWIVLSLIDEVLNPAYNTESISSLVPPFNFLQRVAGLWSLISTEIYRTFLFLPNENKYYERIFGPIVEKRGRSLPPYDVLRHNASLMLGNSHVSLGQATRLPQNYKPIAGYHIDSVVKPLPEDLKTLMDNTKNGVIYFSMGSNLRSKDMPEVLKKDLLKMFGGLKYTVIWKFEEKIPDAPKNVRILQWAPQQSILAHPNCILFITHGGLLSTTETVHYAVPVIGVPVFADQFINVERAVNKGFAKRVDLSYEMANDLKAAIEELTSNRRYTEKVRELSFIYHHRPASPRAELVHWVEHVVRTRGAPHLRSPALMVPWYQKMYIDLVAVILALLTIIIIVSRRLFCSTKKVNALKKNK